MKFLVVVFAFLAVANAVSFFDLVKEEWNSYKVINYFLIIVYSGTYVCFNLN